MTGGGGWSLFLHLLYQRSCKPDDKKKPLIGRGNNQTKEGSDNQKPAVATAQKRPSLNYHEETIISVFL